MLSFGFSICTRVTPGVGLAVASSAVARSSSSAAFCTFSIAVRGPANSLRAAACILDTASGSVSMRLTASSRSDQAAAPTPTTMASSSTPADSARGMASRSRRSTSGPSA